VAESIQDKVTALETKLSVGILQTAWLLIRSRHPERGHVVGFCGSEGSPNERACVKESAQAKERSFGEVFCYMVVLHYESEILRPRTPAQVEGSMTVNSHAFLNLIVKIRHSPAIPQYKDFC
jgi:hypothetical protein